MAEQENEVLKKEQSEALAEDGEDVGLEDENETGGTEAQSDAEEGGKADGEDIRPEDEAAGGTPESREARKAAKKQAKQDKKAEAFKEQIAQLEDKVKRQLAEFENFSNRREKEKQDMLDNFERGMATVPEYKKEDPFVDGMNRIYRQLLTELENIGVKPIEAVGREFDPNLHNAVMQVESEEYESGVVAQELQKGYTYRDTVVRHSMVAVVS